MVDFRGYSNIRPVQGAGLLSGLLEGFKQRGTSQLAQDKLDREQQALNIGYAQKGIDPARLQDQAYLSEVAQRQSTSGTGNLFGETKDAFLSAVRTMNDPRFQELDPQLQQNIKDRVNYMSKNLGNVGQQAFSAAQGKGQAELGYKPELARQTALSTGLGKAQAAGQEELASQTSKLPELINVVKELGELGKEATYTYGGQGVDILARELGQTTPGAKARTEYIAKVNNQVLPLLRDTFGAAFTVQEGESLKATLGAPNKSPEEKEAVLQAFIKQKIRNIQSQQRKLGGEVQQPMQQPVEQEEVIEWGSF